MIAPSTEASTRPRLHPAVVLGPGLVDGAKTVHHVKDRRTGWFFRMGEREFFVVSRLDGQRSLEDVGREYADRFGRRLGERHWEQIITMLASRQLLAGGEDRETLSRLTVAAREQSRGRRSWLHVRLPLANPDRILGAVEPRTRWLFSPLFVVPALIAILAMEGYVASQLDTLLGAARQAWQSPGALVAFILLTWTGLVLHEGAHGLTCKHYGGAAPEIGFIWRFPILAPYSKADDVVLFRNRRHRVYTAFAGVFTSLLILLPFAGIWMLAPSGSPVAAVAAAMVLFGSAAAVLNLVPFLRLDGYYMLNHSLGLLDLRTGSYRFWSDLVRSLWHRRSPSPAGDRGTRWAYGLYGATTFALATAASLMVGWFWFLGLRAQAGALLAALTVLLGAAGFIGIGVVLSRRARAAAARLPGTAAITGATGGAGPSGVPS